MNDTGVVFGLAAGGRIVKSDPDAADDAGQPIPLRLESQPWALAGVSGEWASSLMWLTVASTMPVTLSIVPIVDNVELPAVVAPIVLAAHADRHKETLEIPLFIDNGAFTYALRGTFFTLRITVDALAAGYLSFEAATIEYDVVVESLEAAS